MGERSHTPGLIARKRKSGPDRLYWNADNVSRKAKGYPDRLIPLPDDATDRRPLRDIHGEAPAMASSGAAPALAL
jgi:hypothetical protein